VTITGLAKTPPATTALGDERPFSGLRPIRPVVWWAAAGAAFVVLQVGIYAAWFISGDARPQTMGADDMDSGAKVVAWLVQLASSGALVGAVIYCVRRWRREGAMPWDAMLAVGWLSVYWQEVTCNYLRPIFLYNSYAVNLGSWYANVPGWVSPHAEKLPEPLLLSAPVYGYWFIICSSLFCAMARRAKRRWPDIGRLGLFGLGVAVLGVMDLVLELIFIRTGMFAYAGVIRELSIWGGETYQFPIYEPLLIGSVCSLMGLLRYCRDDHGHSAIERGAETITTRRRASLVRTLAFVGVANVVFGLFNAGYVWISLYVDPAPKYPSYLTNGMCGPGTDTPCPGPGVPIIR
jgi:hypothetical protein